MSSPSNPGHGFALIAAQVWDRSPDFITVVDRNYGIRYANPAYSQSLGLTSTQLLGRHLEDFLGHESFQTTHQSNLDQCLSGQPMSYQSQVFLPMLGLRFLEFQLTPFNSADHMIEGIVLIAQDKTKEKQILQALKQKEARFQHAADHPLVMMYASDAAGTRNFFNQQWLDFTGGSFDEECQQTWLYRVHPDDLLTSAKGYQTGIATGYPFTLNYRLQRADGEFRMLQEQGGALWSPEGAMDGYLGCAIDITELNLQKS